MKITGRQQSIDPWEALELSDFPPPLGDHDRCDACGARAVGQALLAHSSVESERLLVFCGHHLQVHGHAIVARGGALIVPRGAHVPAQGAPGDLRQRP